MEFLTKKYGPLPGYAWAGIAAGGLYLYMRSRSSSSSAASGSGDTAAGFSPANTGEAYGSGYDTGYTAGAASQTAPQGSQYCRAMKDPKGHRHLVCGQGHFIRVRGGYEWLQGPKRAILSGTRSVDARRDREAAQDEAAKDREARRDRDRDRLRRPRRRTAELPGRHGLGSAPNEPRQRV
jgi:hypothetical protein